MTVSCTCTLHFPCFLATLFGGIAAHKSRENKAEQKVSLAAQRSY